MLKEKLEEVRALINEALERSKRKGENVQLLPAIKYASNEQVKEIQSLGISEFGENKVQDAVARTQELKNIRWHMIGHLQTNKVKLAVKHFDIIQSVDSVKLARKINQEAQAIDKVQEIFIEINIGQEAQKYGFSPEEMPQVLEEIKILPSVKLAGLMTMAPETDDAETTRPYFQQIKNLFDRARKTNPDIRHLSMGMSHDFEVAIEEGSTMVRLGRMLFS